MKSGGGSSRGGGGGRSRSSRSSSIKSITQIPDTGAVKDHPPRQQQQPQRQSIRHSTTNSNVNNIPSSISAPSSIVMSSRSSRTALTTVTTTSSAPKSRRPSQIMTDFWENDNNDPDQKQQQQQQRVDDDEEHYDLAPVSATSSSNINNNRLSTMSSKKSSTPAFSVDPWEVDDDDDDVTEFPRAAAATNDNDDDHDDDNDLEKEELVDDDNDNDDVEEQVSTSDGGDGVFILPGDIHPNMEHKEADIERLRLLAGKLSAEWKMSESSGGIAAPALARRIRDFQFAQEKRRKKYGDERPWGILGLYDHLSSIRIDVEWAEDAARRRANGESYQSWADFDESKTSGLRNRPFFTYFLLFVCTIVLIASIAVNGWKVEPLDENPMIGPSAETLILMGAKDSNLIVNENQGWRLLTATVLHAGLVHYFINMLALWFVGGAIETSHGWIAAMIIFISSAVGGTILSAIFLPDYITVGASGGIFGMIGACLADCLVNWKLLFCDFVTENSKKQSHIMVVAVLILDIVLNALIGLTPYVDNFTHLGGMGYGFLCAMSTMARLSSDFFGMEEAWVSRAKYFIMRYFGLILAVVGIVGTLIALLHGDGQTTPCETCTVLSCVSFPPWAPEDAKWWYCDDCGRVTAEIVTGPELHLDLQCPAGNMVTVDLTTEDDVSLSVLRKKLPTFCRLHCQENEEALN